MATAKCKAETNKKERIEVTTKAICQLLDGLELGEALNIIGSIKHKIRSSQTISASNLMD